MNKVILSLILAVCILGMALIMLNERLGRRAEPAPAPLAEISQPAVPDNDAGMPPLPADSDSRGFTAPPEAVRQEFSLPPWTTLKPPYPLWSRHWSRSPRLRLRLPLRRRWPDVKTWARRPPGRKA